MTYTYGKVIRQGKKDGRDFEWVLWPFTKRPKSRVPHAGEKEISPYEMRLKEAGDEIIKRAEDKWHKLDTDLKSKYCQSLKQVTDLRKMKDKETGEAVAAKQQYEEALNKFKSFDKPALTPFWMMLLLIVIGIAEFPLNGLVFQLFGESKFLTYMMAGIMCITIPMAAHFLGKEMRQYEKNWVHIVAIISLVFLSLAALAYIRAEYLADVLENMKKAGIKIEITPGVAAAVFLIINMMVFFIASLVSYEGTHPQHDLYMGAKHNLKDAAMTLKKENAEAFEMESRLMAAEQEFQKISTRRQKTWSSHKARAEEVKEGMESMMAAYRHTNIAARPSDTIPPCFRLPHPEIKIPESLTVLDSECKEFYLVENR